MKNIIALIGLTIILCSCGGVIGNIEKYRFPGYTMDEVKNAVQKVYLKHPELRNFDTTKHIDKQSTLLDGFYYISVEEKEGKFLFKYMYPALVPEDSTVEISLASGAIYGEGMKLAKNIGYLKKRKYKKLFEKYFIDEVKKELQ